MIQKKAESTSMDRFVVPVPISRYNAFSCETAPEGQDAYGIHLAKAEEHREDFSATIEDSNIANHSYIYISFEVAEKT